MRNRNTEFYVGLFILASIIALSFLAINISNYSSIGVKDGYDLTAKFSNIGSLHTQSPVRSSGVLVGRVSKIYFDNEEFLARVTMRIFYPYEFPEDSSAIIFTSGLLGEQYINLDPGGSDESLQEGDEVTLTQSAVVLEQLIGQFLVSQSESSESKE